MTAPKTPDTTSTTDNKGETPTGGGLTAGAIRGFIREEIVNLLPGKSTKDTPATPGTSDQPADIKAEVAAALKQLKSKEDRDAKDARVDKMLADYEKPAPEVAPKETRRVHKIMGWGE